MPTNPNPQTTQGLANWLDDFQQSAPAPATEYPSKSFDLQDQINAMPNSEKLSPVENWIYKKLPGFGENKIVKALSSFAASPAGKVLQYLDVGAEGLERTFGVLAQFRDRDPDEVFKLKDAWAAGSLFYDVAKLPRVQYGEDGRVTGIRIDSDMPGAYALTEARHLMEQGKSIEEVREILYDNMGALALRAQLQDTLGHIGLDPATWVLGWIKPIERVHAIRNLALTGKMSPEVVQALQAEAKLAGRLDDVAALGQALEKAKLEGKALTRLDKFAISLSGGTPWLQDTTKMTKGQQTLAKLNPFALTPQARASEMLDMVAANVGEHLIRPNWFKDPEEFLNALAGAARGAIGNEWGHLAATVQGRTVQGVLSNADAVAKTLGQEWKVYANERGLLQRFAAALPGTDERKLWKLAQENPQLLMKKIQDAAIQPGNEALLAELQAGNITPDLIQQLGKIDKSIPLMREEFYTKALVGIQDVAMKQSILQFGVSEKGLLTKWTDALKAWETIPFIKANPANMVRNFVNNDITLVGRGLYGVMSDKHINDFWQGKWIPPQFQRGFSLSGDELAAATGGFDPGSATKALNDVLEGKGGLASKVKETASNIDLKMLDFSKWSAKFEAMASKRASTNGWMQFHQQYWNPRTGFTSVSKHLPTADLERMEAAIPGISDILDDVAQASGADAQKFAELMQSSIEHNVATIFKNTSDRLGYKVEDVLGTEVIQTLQQGLPDAIQKGQVRQFIDTVRSDMERHVDDMFNKHIENLPGIIAAQVQAGGALQYHRIFGKALDEFWGGNIEHSIRMSSINEVMDAARQSGDWSKVGSLWEKIMSDGEAHFGRVWKKFDAYQEGLRQGAKNAGVKYPQEVQRSFEGMQRGWREFFNFRNSEYKKFFESGKQAERGLDQIEREVDTMYRKMIKEEDRLYQQIDDLMAKSLSDKVQRQMYMNYRDQASQLRMADREKTADFFARVRTARQEEAPDMWQAYWQERGARLEQIRQLDMRGSAAIQGDADSTALFLGSQAQEGADEATDIFGLANKYGVASATKSGARNNRRVLNTINKYLPEGTEKFKKVEDIPLDVARRALDERAAREAQQVAGGTTAAIPDAEKIFPDPMPIETALSEMNYGRSYAAIDAMVEEATAQTSKKSRLLKDLPEDLQEKVMQWGKRVDEEGNAFRAAGVQFAAFRRDSALLNYNRRTNFDNWVGHMAPFAFWTTHSVFNWAVHSLDRPAMLTSYFRSREFFETAGLPDQNVPKRLKGNIRVNLPFTPDWMGDTFVNPMRFLLPFDGFMSPWEQAQQGKLTNEGKAKDTLNQMLENGDISQDQFNDAIQNQSGDAWDTAMQQVMEGGDNYDAMDFMSMTMTPHAPLMWAYNAMKGTPQDIGPFTPMSRTMRNVATMMGVDDWSNSPYNVEGRIRKSLGLPAYDKWDDYRVGREISNMAASLKYSMDDVNEAMQVAALVESGKMTSEEAVRNNKLYAEATKRANQEAAGGWAGTILSILGIPVRAYPEGEQQQRALGEQFSQAYQKYENGDVEALTKFFDDHPEYESRLALFKSPEERLKNFMVDNIWARWNELPKVNQDEIKDQMGENFATYFLNKETRNYETLSPLQLQLYLKLMGGKPVGTLTAEQEALAEFNQLQLTDPETAWRVQTFYDMRNDEFPDFYKLQNKYYALPEGASRKKYVSENPQLKEYWDARRDWMTKNPDLVRFLTDDPKQLAKFAKMRRDPEEAVPTREEIMSNFSPEMQELLADWQQGDELPYSLSSYLQGLAYERGLSANAMMGILTNQR